MDVVTALNVTIYGLGIVFLALLVVMFVIMVLSRIFAAATGKDFMAAPIAEEGGVSDEIPLAKSAGPVPTPASSPPLKPAPPKSASLAPVPSPGTVHKPVVGGGRKVTAPLPGKVITIAVKAGDTVRKGDELCVIEAMKMSNSIKSQQDCAIKDVLVSVGDSVHFGTLLFVVE